MHMEEQYFCRHTIGSILFVQLIIVLLISKIIVYLYRKLMRQQRPMRDKWKNYSKSKHRIKQKLQLISILATVYIEAQFIHAPQLTLIGMQLLPLKTSLV